MKYIITLLLITSSSILFSQRTETIHKTVSVAKEVTISLNGGMRASVGGKSRNVISFTLPKNTVEWYYAFSTNAGTSGTQNLNLGIQLASKLETSGIASLVASQVKIPNGSNSIDVYLLDDNNVKAFIEKWDNNGGTYYYKKEGSAMNIKSGTIGVKNIKSGHWNLGLKNPSSLDGTNVTIEVIAIVEETKYIDEWTDNSFNSIKSQCLKLFNTNEYGKNEVCDCVVKKITSENNPSTWNNTTANTKNNIYTAFQESCYISTDNIALKEAEQEFIRKRQEEERIRQEQRKILNDKINNVRQILNEGYAYSEISDYNNAIIKYNEAISYIIEDNQLKSSFKLADIYNTVAWCAILNNQLEEASKYLKDGLMYDSRNMFIRGNLALYFLLTNEIDKASSAYDYFKPKEKSSDGRKWKDLVAGDLDELEKLGRGNEWFDVIRKQLKIKIKK